MLSAVRNVSPVEFRRRVLFLFGVLTRKDDPMYQKNDTVIYGSHGVCTILDISEQKFGDKTAQYYVLKPVSTEKSTIFIPVDSPILSGRMRRILSAEEIYRMLEELPEEPSVWFENTDQRKDLYKKTLADGNRMELIKLIRSLYLHQEKQVQKGKKLYAADDHALKEAERMLYDEFAFVLNIESEQVLPFILNQLHIDEAKKDCPAAV